MIPLRLVLPVLLLIGGNPLMHSAQGGCRCHGKHRHRHAAPFPVCSGCAAAAGVAAPFAYGPDMHAPDMPGPAPPAWPGPHGMVPAPQALPDAAPPRGGPDGQWQEHYPVQPPVSRDPSPPPGTIGQTYQLRSKPVPVDMHPRVALLDVYVPNATNVFVHDMNPYRTQDRLDGFQDVENPDMWHFETEPLYPGLPRIYRIEARIPGDDGPRMEERYVRLIMGRVLELRF
jgi:hypothetical protein